MIFEMKKSLWKSVFGTFWRDPFWWDCKAKKKQTERVLRKMYYSPQSKNSISLEVGVEKNNFSQIQLLEIFYVLVDTRQNQKKKIPGLPCP